MSNLDEAAGVAPADNTQAAIAADNGGAYAFAKPASDGRLTVSPAALESLGTILRNHGHDPHDADAGWRSENPIVGASLFAAHGYPSSPCDLFKHPSTVNGFYDATTNVTRIFGLDFWHDWEEPICGWLVRTGRYDWGGPTGLWCFDIDGSEGYQVWDELVEKLGPPPPTWATHSGSNGGGGHILYAPANYGPDMKTVGKALISGKRGKIDQRGRGGYFVAPGSLHKSGNRYRWKDGHAPDEIPLATLPPAWVDAMDKADERAPKSASSSTSRSSPRVRIAKEDRGGTQMGDGDPEVYGGFQNPIYALARQYFFKAGVEAPAEPIIEVIRELIIEAPKGPERDVGRYMDGSDLPRIVERGRAYVKKVKEEESDQYDYN